MAIAAGAPVTPRRRSRVWRLSAAGLFPLALVMLVVPCASLAHEHRGPRAPLPAAARSRSGLRAATATGAAGVTDPFTTPGLRAYLRGREGNITAGVEDLETGQTMLYRPGHAEHTASIVKVDILATLLHEKQGNGGLDGATQALATGMIESSDDDDASDLFDAEGGPSAVQGFDDQVGMHQTRANTAWGLTTTTPQDQIKLLRFVLFPNRLLTATSRHYEYGLMRHIIPFDTWGVTAGLGHGARVAFKNGWLPYQGSWQVNSIGSVIGSGRHYLIAVMTDGSPTEDYGIDTIERISATVWQTLGNH